MIKTINFKGKLYPEFQSKGNASKFAFPFAKEVCTGEGYDIGCMKIEWSLPGSIPIDISFEDDYHALNLPKNVDYIFSSHCLEHIDNWVDTMDYWYEKINKNGTIFLYLPDYSQEYWRPWFNKKHKQIFSPMIIEDYMKSRGYIDIFVSGIDLNNSFMIMATKP